jgi:hypothetical protein
MDKFIGVYENAFSHKFCDDLVNWFNALPSEDIKNRQTHDNAKKFAKEDFFAFLCNVNNKNFTDEFDSVFWGECYKKYAYEFDILNTIARHISLDYKIQKTEIGGGYHIWHCEADSLKTSNRILVWMLYLNDVEEGGETEFLYQHLRIKPKKGTLVIWPASFTYVHRGNPPLSNTKYALTGWVQYE